MEIREEIFNQANYHAPYKPMRATRIKHVKYPSFGNKKTPVLPNRDEGFSKQYRLDNGWKDIQLMAEELSNLTFNPNERNNLVNNPGLWFY